MDMKTVSMSDAILEMFSTLGEKLKVLGFADDSIKAYLFGGCAVHILAQSRFSIDVDVEFEYDQARKHDLQIVLSELPPIDFDDPDMGPSRLIYDCTFNTTLGPLHEDYISRASLFSKEEESPVSIWLPSPEDIAISKLGRMNEVDVEDICTLLNLPDSSWERFEILANEANSYYVGSNLTSNICYVKKKFEEIRGNI
jgi:hypothetical protein